MPRFLSFIFLLLIVCGAGSVSAQQIGLPPVGARAYIVPDTDVLNPGQVVMLTLKSFSVELEENVVVWSVNGKTQSEGVGLTTQEVTLGQVGDITTVSALVYEGATFITRVDASLAPASVDLLWESKGYVHPFYTGRNMPSVGSRLVAEARPILTTNDGALVPNSRVTFVWSLNNTVLETLSGVGKSTLSLPLSAFAGNDVLEVAVSSGETAAQAHTRVRIPSQQPYLVLYKVDPLAGIDFRNAVLSSDISKSLESDFTLVPYFAAIRNLKDPDIRVDWRVNDTAVPPHSDDPFTITLVAPETGAQARLQASLSHTSLFQLESVSSWLLKFGESAGGVFDVFRRSTN